MSLFRIEKRLMSTFRISYFPYFFTVYRRQRIYPTPHNVICLQGVG